MPAPAINAPAGRGGRDPQVHPCPRPARNMVPSMGDVAAGNGMGVTGATDLGMLAASFAAAQGCGAVPGCCGTPGLAAAATGMQATSMLQQCQAEGCGGFGLGCGGALGCGLAGFNGLGGCGYGGGCGFGFCGCGSGSSCSQPQPDPYGVHQMAQQSAWTGIPPAMQTGLAAGLGFASTSDNAGCMSCATPQGCVGVTSSCGSTAAQGNDVANCGSAAPGGGFDQQAATPESSASWAKPGDWYCPQCNDLQFARNMVCRKCNTPNFAHAMAKTLAVTANMKPGDWLCPSCCDLQFARNTHCRKCATTRPDQGTAEGGMPAPVRPGGPIPRFGDWVCPTCGDHQFRRNLQCNRCRTPNPNPSSAGGKGGAPHGGGAESSSPLGSHWKCPSCSDVVFARLTTCSRCGTSNPLSTPSQQAEQATAAIGGRPASCPAECQAQRPNGVYEQQAGHCGMQPLSCSAPASQHDHGLSASILSAASKPLRSSPY